MPKIFHKKLMTWVHRLEYDWDTRFGRVWTGGPTDMSGCIDLFTGIDPEVCEILTIMNGREDTGYRKDDDEWQAVIAPRKLKRG